MIDDEDIRRLLAPPSMEELKAMIFSMSTYSAPGPDGVSGKFYQTCSEIINEDLLLTMLDLSAGTELPISLTYTCLIMIPKVQCQQRFTKLRPISLSTISSKIIFKLMK